MAIVNPPSLYSGGQGILRDNVVDYVTALENKKRAREDALNNYYAKLPDKINLAGVRMQDLEDPNGNGGIMKDIEDWRNMWHTNPEIKKGGLAQQAYMQKFQKILNKVNQSKQEAKAELERGKAHFEGKWQHRESDFPVMEKMAASIYDPNHYKEDGVTSYNNGDLSGSVPLFDVYKQKSFNTGALGTGKPTYDETKARVDNVSGEVFIPKKYDENTIKATADNAANALKFNKSAQYHFEDLLHDPEFVSAATNAYNDFYGTKELVDTPEKAAKADQIMRLSAEAGEEKVKDPNYALALKKKMADYNFEIWKKKQPIQLANQKELIATRERYKNESEEKVVKDVSAFVQGEIDDAVKNPIDITNQMPYAGVRTDITPYKIRTTPTALDIFAQEDAAGNRYKAEGIYYKPDTKTFIIKTTAKDKEGIKDIEIPRNEYEAMLVNKIFNTKIKLNQINTDQTVEGEKKVTKSGSSSTLNATQRRNK